MGRKSPRKTDSSNPADWLGTAEADLKIVWLVAAREPNFAAGRSKLAETLKKF